MESEKTTNSLIEQIYGKDYNESELLSGLLLATQTITYDEYLLISKAFGDNLDNWQKVLYARTALNTLEQFIEQLTEDTPYPAEFIQNLTAK